MSGLSGRILYLFMLLCCFSMTPVWATVNLNTATEAELLTLSGVGPARARAILEWRKLNGKFERVDDLQKVPGFGGKTLEKLRHELTVE